MTFFQRLNIFKGVKSAVLVQMLRRFILNKGDFAYLVKLHWEEYAPAACAAGLFFWDASTANSADVFFFNIII